MAVDFGPGAGGACCDWPPGRFRQLISGSTALQAHQQRMFAAFETALAGVLAEETGARPGAAEPFAAAVALVGVIRAAFEASGPGPDRDTAAATLRLLAGGLSGYAVRPAPPEGLPASC